MDHKYVTLNEIITQTAAWEGAIKHVDNQKQLIARIDLAEYKNIFLIGCGSTYYLSLAAAAVLQSLTGLKAIPLPASEMFILPEFIYQNGKSLLIAISRSGTTSETLHAVRKFKQNRHGDVMVVTNYPDSPLVHIADFRVAIPEGQEQSIAQTRSFTSMFVAINAIFHLLGPGLSFQPHLLALTRSGSEILDRYQHVAERLGNDTSLKQVFFLGSGPRYGLACEASLKLKEMSQTITEPFHCLEFRHGPISMVDENTLVVGLISGSNYANEMAVIRDIKNLGAKTLTLGNSGTDIEFKSELPDSIHNVLYLPVLQLFAYFRAIHFGKNPDFPHNLTAVVKLDL